MGVARLGAVFDFNFTISNAKVVENFLINAHGETFEESFRPYNINL